MFYKGGVVISDQFYHLKFILFGVSVVNLGKKIFWDFFGIWELEGQGVPYSQKYMSKYMQILTFW